MEHAFTVGVEEEFQIVDPNTWELRSHVQELLASSAPAFGDTIKPSAEIRDRHGSRLAIPGASGTCGPYRGAIFTAA